MNLSQRMKLFREIMGLSQKKMGELLSLPQTSYSNYENTVRQLPNEIIQRLSQIGLDINWLITGKVNTVLCNSIRDSLVLNNAKRMAVDAEVPLSFIEAIRDCKISPSIQLIERLDAKGYAITPVKCVNEDRAEYGNPIDVVELKKERDWLRKQNEELLDIIKSLKKE